MKAVTSISSFRGAPEMNGTPLSGPDCPPPTKPRKPHTPSGRDARRTDAEQRIHTRVAPHAKTHPCTIPNESMRRSEEHTSELQSLMRNSYAVFCLKRKKTNTKETN